MATSELSSVENVNLMAAIYVPGTINSWNFASCLCIQMEMNSLPSHKKSIY
jgi:hypothetical protein